MLNKHKCSSRPLRLRRQLSLPKSFLQRVRMPWPTNGPAFRSMLFPQSLCYRRYSGESGSNGTNRGCLSYSSCWKQPRGRPPWDRNSSLAPELLSSTAWLDWFPYSIEIRRSTSEIPKGNVLGYCRNLGSLTYGNEYCIPGRAMSCTP